MKYIIFSLLILFTACASDAKSDKVDVNTVNEVQEEPKIIANEGLSISVLQEHPWEIEIVLDNGDITDKNKWKKNLLTFEEDGSYIWQGSAIDNKGSYKLDQNKNIILLNSENPDLSSEWSIKHRRSMMVWIGTPKFGHHALQMKLIKKPLEIN